MGLPRPSPRSRSRARCSWCWRAASRVAVSRMRGPAVLLPLLRTTVRHAWRYCVDHVWLRERGGLL